MKRFIISALTVVMASAVLTSVEAQSTKRLSKSYGTSGDMLRLTNALRKENGVPEVGQHDKLDEIARRYARLMAEKDQKSTNLDSGFAQRMHALGFYSWAVNLASHDRLNDRHNAAFLIWANSKRDRFNMLSRTRNVMGSGYAVSKSGKCYYCQVLASYIGPPGAG
jgi:uncharacterized protein YkwD